MVLLGGATRLHDGAADCERGTCSYTVGWKREAQLPDDGTAGRIAARLRCWLGERDSATLLTGQLHDSAASWTRGVHAVVVV